LSEAKFRAFDALWRYFIFVQMRFRKFVKPNWSFTSKCYPNIRDDFLCHNKSRTSRIYCLRHPVALEPDPTRRKSDAQWRTVSPAGPATKQHSEFYWLLHPISPRIRTIRESISH